MQAHYVCTSQAFQGCESSFFSFFCHFGYQNVRGMYVHMYIQIYVNYIYVLDRYHFGMKGGGKKEGKAYLFPFFLFFSSPFVFVYIRVHTI